MMNSRIQVSSIFILAACLSACAGGGNNPLDPELIAVPENCGLAGARLVRDREDRGTVRLSLPIDADQPTEGQLSCVSLWARERGMTLVFVPGLIR